MLLPLILLVCLPHRQVEAGVRTKWRKTRRLIFSLQLSQVYVQVPVTLWGNVLKSTDNVSLPEGLPNFLHPDPDQDLLFVRNLTMADPNADESDITEFLLNADEGHATKQLTVLHVTGNGAVPNQGENVVILVAGRVSKCEERSSLGGNLKVVLVEEPTGQLGQTTTTTTTSTSAPSPNTASGGGLQPPPKINYPQSVNPRTLQTSNTNGTGTSSYEFSARVQEGCRCRKGKTVRSDLKVPYVTFEVDCNPILQIPHTLVPTDDLANGGQVISDIGYGLIAGTRESEFIIPIVWMT